MAGLIQQGMQKEPMGQPAGQPMGQQMGQAEEQEGTASPAEQEQYDRIVMAAMKIIYDDEANKAIMEMLASGKDNPAEALTQTAATILQHISEKAGGVPMDIQAAAAEEVLAMLAELADKAGIFTVDEAVIEQTSMQMAQTLVGTQQGNPNGQLS